LLDGIWKFKWLLNPESHPVDFDKTDFDISGWEDIVILATGKCRVLESLFIQIPPIRLRKTSRE